MLHLSNKRHVVAVPTNGLVIYCGTIVTDEGKEKKVNIDFEPFKAINTSLYLCDNKFHTEVSIVFLLEIRGVAVRGLALPKSDIFALPSIARINGNTAACASIGPRA